MSKNRFNRGSSNDGNETSKKGLFAMLIATGVFIIIFIAFIISYVLKIIGA